jgi:hypothetical protein
MTEKFAPPQVFVRRYKASEICDVVVLVRSQEMVLRCPAYSQALKWARLECKSYNIPEPKIEPISGLNEDKMPLFLRSPETTEAPGGRAARPSRRGLKTNRNSGKQAQPPTRCWRCCSRPSRIAKRTACERPCLFRPTKTAPRKRPMKSAAGFITSGVVGEF